MQKKYAPHSGAQDAGFYVSFAVDDLPAFETVPPEQMASWRHLLQSNILDIFFDTTAEHLAKLGFERSVNVDPDTTPPATKAQSNAPNSLVFPFFVAGCDEHSGKCGFNGGNTSHSCLPVSVACATALEVLRRLEGIADSDEASSSEAQLPAVIAMAFAGKHVGVWAVDRIDDTDLHVSESQTPAAGGGLTNHAGWEPEIRHMHLERRDDKAPRRFGVDSHLRQDCCSGSHDVPPLGFEKGGTVDVFIPNRSGRRGRR